MSFSTFFLLPTYLAKVLHADNTAIGAVSAAGALAGVFAFPAVGTLNDRYGRLRFLLLGNALMTLTALAMLTNREVGPVLYVLRVLQGLAFALSFNSTTTLATDHVNSASLGRVLALFGTSLLATNALAPWLAEIIAANVGWDAVFWTATAFGAVSTLFGFLFLSESKRPGAGTAQHTLSLRALLTERRMRLVVASVAAAGAGFGTLFTFYQPYALKLGIERVGGFFVAYAVCALAVRFLAVNALERFGRQRVSAGSLLLYALAVASTAWLRPGALELIGAVTGLAHGVYYPVCNALALELVPGTQRGAVMSLYHGGFNGGFALAGVLGGGLAERFGYPALFLLAGAVVSLLGVTLWHADLHVHQSAAAPG
jgi:MFS family permease